MKRGNLVRGVAVVALTAAAVGIAVSAEQLKHTSFKTAQFDSRTFEYRGHVGYRYTQDDGMGASRLDAQPHGPEQCGIAFLEVCFSNHFAKECRITAGNTIYSHSFKVKILKNGAPAGSMWEVVYCEHGGESWVRNKGNFAQTGVGGDTDDTYAFRVTIRNGNGTEVNSTDVALN